MRLIHLLILAVAITACSKAEPEPETVSGDSTLLIESPFTFVNPEMTSASGAQITIVNQDDVPHTVTSQSAPGAFDDTGDFDAIVGSEGVQIFVLPEAPSGTEFYFYCRFHQETMIPDSGTITIQ